MTSKQRQRKLTETLIEYSCFLPCSSIIDVGALECHTLEQHEYIERVRTYNQRVNAIPQVKVSLILLSTTIEYAIKFLVM